MKKRKQAIDLNQRGIELEEHGRHDEAILFYRQAHVADPSWSVPLYNLGLVFKRQKRWEESLEFNQRAAALAPDDDAAWWNLGIAATALGRWDVARQAWRGYKIPIPDGEGPIDFPCGFGPIRLNPDSEGEVVWAYRLDPARAELASIPLPESRHRWRDIILNDGAPVGYRQYGGQELPVFNALELLQASPFGTYVATIAMFGDREQIARLAQTAERLEGSAEDWTTSTKIICKACSEGRPHEMHDTAAPPADGVHVVGVAARSREHASEILFVWESGEEDVEVQSLDDALEPGPS
jgi:hypothetical protein